MARVAKTTNKDHAIRIIADGGADFGGEFIVVKGGRRAYLWVGIPNKEPITLTGSVALRRLAHAILKETKARP